MSRKHLEALAAVLVFDMTQEEFVRNVKVATLDTVVTETLSALLKPAGRRPDRSNQATADWYQSLSDEGKKHARILAQLVAHNGLFGVFATLDGVSNRGLWPER